MEHIEEVENQPISGRDELVEWFADGCKEPENWKIGVEHEKTGYQIGENGLLPLQYDGKLGIKYILEQARIISDMTPIMDQGNIIGLKSKKLGASITLEPGGQFELSGMPLKNIRQACEEITSHINLLRKIVRKGENFGFTPIGVNPKWSLDEIPRMPKSRYAIMEPNIKAAGGFGVDMMFMTSTVQVNLDFSCESDMKNKMYVATKLQLVATALFCNSPIRQGRISEYHCLRGLYWLSTDKKRSGLLQMALDKSINFDKYTDYILDIPMYFVVRSGIYHQAKGQSFKDYMQNGLHGKPHIRATMADWDNHMTAVFPEVRLKKFIEMRGADAGDHDMLCALPALWVGLLYDSSALDEAIMLADTLAIEDIMAARKDTMRNSLSAMIGRRSVGDIAKEVVQIAKKGLSNRARNNSEINDESHFLMPLIEIIDNRTTRAQELVREFKRYDYDIDKLLLSHNIMAN